MQSKEIVSVFVSNKCGPASVRRVSQILTEERILAWADAHHRLTGRWPKSRSGKVRGAGGTTWTAVQLALIWGRHGLPGGSSLAKLLAAKRGVRNRGALPKFTEERILAWADAHHLLTGRWPKHNSGAIDGSGGETWEAVNGALVMGLRGCPGGSSLAKFLSARRGFVRQGDRQKLTVERILAWADAHHRLTGRWPKRNSGLIVGTDGETWEAVNAALRDGGRGMPGGTSVERLLAAQRGAPLRPRRQSGLTEIRILNWADEHHRRTGRWPKRNSGPIVGVPGETWRAVDYGLSEGCRGLPGGTTLANLLAARRGTPIVRALPKLTEEQILAWADAHYRETGTWPLTTSGTIAGAQGERWSAVSRALQKGTRGLTGGTSLAVLLLRRRMVRQRLTEEQILAWADEHYRRTKRWPTKHSGIIARTNGDRWRRVAAALQYGRRGLPGGMTLAKLLFARRGVAPEPVRKPCLTREQILAWADAHYRRTGRWPTGDSGAIAGSGGETWGVINTALSKGCRGFPGGSSLSKLLATALRTRPRF